MLLEPVTAPYSPVREKADLVRRASVQLALDSLYLCRIESYYHLKPEAEDES